MICLVLRRFASRGLCWPPLLDSGTVGWLWLPPGWEWGGVRRMGGGWAGWGGVRAGGGATGPWLLWCGPGGLVGSVPLAMGPGAHCWSHASRVYLVGEVWILRVPGRRPTLRSHLSGVLTWRPGIDLHFHTRVPRHPRMLGEIPAPGHIARNKINVTINNKGPGRLPHSFDTSVFCWAFLYHLGALFC